MPEVATEALQMSDMHLSEGKCTLSTLIFQKFSGSYAPRPHPLGTPALRASAPRSGPSVPPSSCPPLTKILATRLSLSKMLRRSLMRCLQLRRTTRRTLENGSCSLNCLQTTCQKCDPGLSRPRMSPSPWIWISITSNTWYCSNVIVLTTQTDTHRHTNTQR